MKFYIHLLIILIVFFFEGFTLLAQNSNFPINSLTNRIEYRRIYPSIFPGKNVVIKNWIDNEFHYSYPENAIQNSIFSVSASVPITSMSASNKSYSEIRYILQIWNKTDRIQLSINNLHFFNINNKQTYPLESIIYTNEFSNETIEQIFSFAKSNIDSLIYSFEQNIIPYISFTPDLIILKGSSDSINCNIVEENNSQIKYKIYNSSDSNIYISDISNIEYYLKQKEITIASFEELPKINPISSSKKKDSFSDKNQLSKSKGYFSLNFGISYRTSPLSPSVPSNLNKYVNELRKGYGLSGNASYYLKGNFGLGMAFYYTQSSNSTAYNYITNNSIIIPGTLKDVITVTCFAPSFCYRIIAKEEKLICHLNCFVGLLAFENKKTFNYSKVWLSGSTLGYGTSVSIDKVLGKSVVIGFTFSYISGYLSNIRIQGQVNYLEPDEWEGLNRIEIGIGLRLYLKERSKH